MCMLAAQGSSTADRRATTSRVSDEDAHSLLSLGPLVAGMVLHAVGSLATCLNFLLQSCHSVAVSAAGMDATLTLDTVHHAHEETSTCNYFLEGIASALREFPSRTLSLSVFSLSNGNWLVALLTSMPHLQCVEIVDCECALPANVLSQS